MNKRTKTHYLAQPYRGANNEFPPIGTTGCFYGDHVSPEMFFTHKFRKLAVFGVRYAILRRGPLGLESIGEDWMLDRELGFVRIPAAVAELEGNI